MRKKMVALLFVVPALILGWWCLYLQSGEKTVFSEEFRTALHWDRQCTKADVTGHLSTPSVTKEFTTASVTSTDGMLHLCTGSGEHTGGGEWRRPVEIKVGRDTLIEWKWAAYDPEDYQFWIRLRFNNNRTLYYKASDSRQPGFYRKERYMPYKGEKFRDREGRLRFFPSVTILVGRPANKWMVHKRTISNDYQQSYGQVPVNLAISEITIGMMDDSKAKVNEMGIEYIQIYYSYN
ncbi:MAG: hypothetical protein PVH87_13950 [Desulfobacteraceae bacterium]|jgi:hypothetical protein